MYLRNCRFVLFCDTLKGLGSLKVISFSNFCLKNHNTFCTRPEILKQSNTVLPDNILRQGLSVLFKTLKASPDVLASKTFVKIAFECAQRCLKTTKGPIKKSFKTAGLPNPSLVIILVSLIECFLQNNQFNNFSYMFFF